MRQWHRPAGGRRRCFEIENRLVVECRPGAAAGDDRIRSADRKRRARRGGRCHERHVIVERSILEERQIERARDRTRLRRAGTGRCGLTRAWPWRDGRRRLRSVEPGQREIAERSDRFVAGLDRQIERCHVDRQRELVPAVPAARLAVEADVLALRTLHGRGTSCGAGGGAGPEAPARAAARSWPWIVARSLSASAARASPGPIAANARSASCRCPFAY